MFKHNYNLADLLPFFVLFQKVEIKQNYTKSIYPLYLTNIRLRDKLQYYQFSQLTPNQPRLVS